MARNLLDELHPEFRTRLDQTLETLVTQEYLQREHRDAILHAFQTWSLLEGKMGKQIKELTPYVDSTRHFVSVRQRQQVLQILQQMKEKIQDLTLQSSTEELLAVIHRAEGEDVVKYQQEIDRYRGWVMLLGTGCVCSRATNVLFMAAGACSILNNGSKLEVRGLGTEEEFLGRVKASGKLDACVWTHVVYRRLGRMPTFEEQ